MMDEFDFPLPDERIAIRPVVPRDAARLLIIHGDGRCEHAMMTDLPELLCSRDVLVANDSKVMPAALSALRPPRSETGAAVPIRLNLIAQCAGEWTALARPAKRLEVGEMIEIDSKTRARITHRQGGEIRLQHVSGPALEALMEQSGNMPLPPYIARRREADARDHDDYQTIFAKASGSVAAPTAGLHFTPELVRRLEAAGILMQYLTLHVGIGTFAPIRAGLDEHEMHSEWCSIAAETAAAIVAARAAGQRCIAVGTTSLRVLETAARSEQGLSQGFAGATRLFIRPGDRFMITDALLTNFHQPRSTLFVLVCALMGTKIMRSAYHLALDGGYRFCSYGDACLLLPHD